MDDFLFRHHENSKQITPRIRELQSTHQRPVVVAIDGGSGSGKSTLAAILAEKLRAALIPMDDFYAAHIPDQDWDNFTVKERFIKSFDWERLRETAIKPLRTCQPARWYAFDFVSGLRPDGTYGMQSQPKTLEPADVILIDGNFSAGPPLADLVDFSILVDMPVEQRHARTAAREDPDFLARWHQLWDPVEDFYYNHLQPKGTYDLVVSG